MNEYIDITIPFLYDLFKECNEEFFSNNLSTPVFKVTNGRKTLGSTHVSLLGLKPPTITISRYYKVTREDVKTTMLHEMIHLWEWLTYKTMSHGTRFKLQAKRIEIMSDNRYSIKRLSTRRSYQVANPKSETNYKNKLYAVFIQRSEEKAWIVACTPTMVGYYNIGLAKCWNLDLVGFVKNRFEPDFDSLPKMSSSRRLKGRTMPWDRLNEKYSEFANCIASI